MLGSLIMLRKEIRADIRNRRKSLSSDFQRQASRDIVRLLQKEYPRIFECRTFALYLTNDGELDTGNLISRLWELGKTVCLPVVDPQNSKRLIFRIYNQDSPLLSNKYGIPEPTEQNPEIALEKLDVIFTPLVAFDDNGNRLGMGGGFYDCTLKERQPGTLVVGLAHDLQKVASLPCEAWDIPLPFIATPTNFYKFKQTKD